MKKMNKKGFTLIEMLVVIAIIAVLVSIIIPVVSNSTVKAAAAANAANLRALQAEATTAFLGGAEDTANVDFIKDANGKVTKIEATATAPVSKACGTFIGENIKAEFDLNEDTGSITVTFGTGKTINYFSVIAETGAEPTEAKTE